MKIDLFRQTVWTINVHDHKHMRNCNAIAKPGSEVSTWL